MIDRFDTRTKVYIVLLATFVGCLVISTVVARKVVVLFGLTSNFGALPYVFTFIITDIVAEIWDKEHARFMLIAGFASLLVSFLWMSIAIVWPAAPFWQDQGAYEVVLGNTFRVMIAGIAAFLAAQFYDVLAFALLKRRHGTNYLWLRTNVSTIPAQVIDSFIFVPIAFGGTMPILPILTGILTFKVIIAFVEQFVVYGVVWFLRHRRFGWSASFRAVSASN